ncbi:GntR family transcriptional regulator [Mesorhizobium sp. VK23B]|uniref:GntR family transcriptional regulator n=1 Tax=Mesorhizobium dulcispinae TaxID=3072316 RepID=A0ABU4X894_9HYPH|nr:MULTISPECIES: GntR family transcriptional regulator [unclassified Mesorhizobium]MDX8464625.1 GntR family transcriptional regulator [Mesorhizobium sp. VK23B]MDX8471011.1 GntR family transcriptional regulator [Mesorhizobium sp. VK23A]
MSIFQKPPQTAPETAYQWLRNEVSKLPWDQEAFLSENAIAEATGLSRTPVREALLRLESTGLVRRMPHRGAYVPALTSADIENMMEVRQVIEEWAVRKVVASGFIGIGLDEILVEQEQHLDDPIAFIETDIRFHQSLLAAAGNQVFDEVYKAQRFKQLRMGVKAVRDGDGRSDHVLAEHRAIADAIRRADAEAAVAAIRTHLQSTLVALRAPYLHTLPNGTLG